MSRVGLCRNSRKFRLYRLFLPAIAASLAGCAINPRLDVADVAVGAPPTVSLQVPFYPQTEYQCGPAALASVLTAAGARTQPRELSAQVYLPERKGSLQVELQAAARRHGRIPFQLDPEPHALLAELARGRPVLVLQNLRTRSLPAWHYAVLVGYDAHRNRLQLHSGKQEGLWVEAPKFLRTWDWSDRWAMIALQPGELPAPFDPGLNFDRNADLSADRNVVLHARLDADPAADPAPQSVDRYLRAVADFEGVAGAAAASPAWQTAAATWPRHRWPALALGNQAYHFGNLEAAAHWYQQGLAANPFDPALANNLASVLGESGCARAAEALLRPVAARLDDESAWRSPIETTLQDLTVHEGSDPDSCAPYVRPPQEVAALPPPP